MIHYSPSVYFKPDGDSRLSRVRSPPQDAELKCQIKQESKKPFALLPVSRYLYNDKAVHPRRVWPEKKNRPEAVFEEIKAKPFNSATALVTRSKGQIEVLVPLVQGEPPFKEEENYIDFSLSTLHYTRTCLVNGRRWRKKAGKQEGRLANESQGKEEEEHRHGNLPSVKNTCETRLGQPSAHASYSPAVTGAPYSSADELVQGAEGEREQDENVPPPLPPPSHFPAPPFVYPVASTPIPEAASPLSPWMRNHRHAPVHLPTADTRMNGGDGGSHHCSSVGVVATASVHSSGHSSPPLEGKIKDYRDTAHKEPVQACGVSISASASPPPAMREKETTAQASSSSATPLHTVHHRLQEGPLSDANVLQYTCLPSVSKRDTKDIYTTMSKREVERLSKHCDYRQEISFAEAERKRMRKTAVSHVIRSYPSPRREECPTCCPTDLPSGSRYYSFSFLYHSPQAAKSKGKNIR